MTETPEPTITQPPETYRITYDLNGGSYNNSTADIVETYEKGTVITIHEAPTRSGYTFEYWKGSEYQPGDVYTVYEDHTFTAQWSKDMDPIVIPDDDNLKYMRIHGEVIWKDSDNENNTRPDEVVVKLMQGETVVQEVTVKQGINGKWEYTFKDVPMYNDDGKNQAIQYTLKQNKVDGYRWEAAFVSQETSGEVLDVTTKITDTLSKSSPGENGSDDSGNGNSSDHNSGNNSQTDNSSSSLNLSTNVSTVGGSSGSASSGGGSRTSTANISSGTSASGSVSAGGGSGTAGANGTSSGTAASGHSSTVNVGGKSSTTEVKTGDETDAQVWIFLMAMSSLLILLYCARRRRKAK